MLNKWQPKAILLDILIPDLDGYKTAKAIRSLPGWENVAIIALSAWPEAEWRAHIGGSLFDRYLTKPVKLETIIEAIDNVLAERAIALAPVVHPK